MPDIHRNALRIYGGISSWCLCCGLIRCPTVLLLITKAEIIVRRGGPTVRVYSRNPNDWTARLAALAAAELIKATSVTIDDEVVVLGPDGLSRFEELSHRQAARTAVLYAFDIIEHDGEDLRNLPFLGRKAALARLLRDNHAGLLSRLGWRSLTKA